VQGGDDLWQWGQVGARDVTLGEDAHQARTRNGPAVAAVLRNTAIGYHRSNGQPNITRASRHADRPPQRPHQRGDQQQPDYAMTLTPLTPPRAEDLQTAIPRRGDGE